MNMKKNMTLVMLFSMICVMMTSISLVRATPPLPESYNDKTIISGIIPLAESNLEVKQSGITIDLVSDNELSVNQKIEREAKVTVKYEVFNPGDIVQMKMAFPFLSCFKYLPVELETKVNGLPISNKLLVSNNDLMPDRDFQKYLNNFTTDGFNEMMFDEYQNMNDLDGYLYTITNPKTKGSNYYAETQLVFHNMPERFFITDCYLNVKSDIPGYRSAVEMYASEETAHFFMDCDLTVTSISTEFKCVGENSYIGNGVLLAPAQVTKQPITLSDYIDQYKINDLYQNYDGPYKQDLRSSFYARFDKAMVSPYDANISSDMRFAQEDFQVMALEFETSFAAQANTVIEVSYLTPIFSSYIDQYHKQINTMEFDPNPASRWKQIKDIEFTVLTDDEIYEPTLPFVEVDDGYQLKLIGKPSQPITISINNPSYVQKTYGCGFLTVYNMVGVMAALMFISFIFHKRT